MILTMRFPNGKAKALTLSYDDGVRQDKKLIKIIDKYGIKGTFNVNSGCFGNNSEREKSDGRMSAEEISELFENSPHEIAVHGLDHGYDDILHNNLMANEIIRDRENIEKTTGRIVRGMAYPFGTFNDKLVDCLKACGIAYSRTVISSEGFGMPKDWLRLETTCHHSNKKLDLLCDKFLEMTPRVPQMFYLWGHSFEFDRNEENNNWEIIEKFSEKMGGHDDIWYATNIEIYDYTKAFEALQFATDQSMVHNPTAIDVWFSLGYWGEINIYCVKAGETLKIK